MPILKDGTIIPKLGQGTWYLGEDKSREKEETASLLAGIRKGSTLIDTAEMYGNGLSEKLISNIWSEVKREDIFLVSKVLPSNANRNKMFQACENSLRRLKTDYLDLYLYHWRGNTPLQETVDCLEELVCRGLIKRWGVSNFDVDDLEELMETEGGENCQVNQVLYHLGSRGIDYDLVPWMEDDGMVLMTYCPMAQGGRLSRQLLNDSLLKEIAAKYGISVYQLLICFTLRHDIAVSIPRSSKEAHALANAECINIKIKEEDWKKIDNKYPKPSHKMWLDME